MVDDEIKDIGEPDIIHGETCPMCAKKSLTLMEHEREIPFFGRVYLFSMTCKECKYHKADIESVKDHDPVRYTLEIDSEDDMNIRIVRSSHCTIKIPRMAEISPAAGSNGFISNVEGVLNRIKKQIEFIRDDSDDKSAKKKAKNMLKKIQDAQWGREKLKLILEDPTGNSVIISDKAVKEKLKKS